MSGLLQDCRHALRMLWKSPGFTVIAVVTLALGIGANVAIFSVVNAVLLRPLDYKNPDQLVVILHEGSHPVAPANFLDWRSQSHSFESMGAAELWGPSLLGSEGTEKVSGLHVSPDIFPMLGIHPLLGRTFLPQEQQKGNDRKVVLSYGLWQRNFGGSQQIVGHEISLDGELHTVIGVMPSGFKFAPFWATKAELWAPLALDQKTMDRAGNSLRIFARLRDGISAAQAQAEISTITNRLEQQFPGSNRNVVVVPLKEKVVGQVRPALIVLLGAVGFVLLIACANVAHMLLARTTARQREIAVRTALGAKRSRIVQQFLAESFLLSLIGGALGLAIAFCGVRILVGLGGPDIPRSDSIGVDGNVLLFTLFASLLTGLAFGLVPALRTSKLNVSASLKEGERGSSEGIRRNRLRSLLVASEFALALMLLAGAGLMIRSFVALQNIDPGFNPHHVLSMVVSVAGSKQAQPGQRATFYQQVLQRAEALPGVESVSAINHLPLAGDTWGFHFYAEGGPLPRAGEFPTATYRVVLPKYFQTMNIPLLRGRDFLEQDHLRAPAVVIVNDWFARRYWPGEDPIGKRITLDDPRQKPSWVTVVGIAKNTVRGQWSAPPAEEIFLPYLQTSSYLDGRSSPESYLTLVVRAKGNAADIASAIRDEIRSLDKNVPISEVQTMDEVVSEATAQSRFYLFLLGAFASVALVLASLGIYGVVSYSVSRRTHEIGIRMALGAAAQDVVKLVVFQGVGLALAGVAVGSAGALALSRLLAGMLYGVQPGDPTTFFSVSLLLSTVAVVATYIPARRAARVDPMAALRYE